VRESLCKCWPRTGLLCNLYGPGLGFSVRTKPWCRFRCVHAPLAQRRPRRGATLYSSIGASGRGSRFIKVGRDLHSSKTRSCEECLRRVRRRVLAVSFTFGRDGAVVDEAERGPGRTSEWGGSRPANPPGVVAGLGFRSREISRTRTTATRHHQAGRPGICDSYSVSDVQDLAQTAFRRRVFHEDVLAVQSTCRWEQPPNLAAGAGDNRTSA